MLGFIIPFKSKLKSKSWKKDSILLHQTICSINNQKSREFKIYIVYTDLPTIILNDRNVFYIEFPFPFLTVNEIEDYEDFLKLHFSDRVGEFMFDQGKRILWGCQYAVKDGCNYVMSVDADDFISNKISEFVQQNQSEKFGWFINSGYILQEKSPFLIKVKKNMNHLNGSTNIINTMLLPQVNFESKKLADFTFFSSHGYLKDRFKHTFKETLKPVPFFCLIYYLHTDNWSSLGSQLKKNPFKTFFKYLFKGKMLNQKIRLEFGVELIK